MLSRPALLAELHAALGRAPVVALLGPRQCGKTTLARQLVPAESANYFDLEDPISLARLDEPLTALGELRSRVVIDEVQRKPELFPLLRVLADRPETPAQFLILGSASPALLRQSSESLAGRLEIVEMEGFSLAEVGLEQASTLWLRGGFPRSFLAANDADSLIWRRDFIRTLLESDLPQLGVGCPQQRCSGSGPCSPMSTASSGTAPNWAAPSASTRPPAAAISICSLVCSWCVCCSPGTSIP